jgi:hypothetical protein
MFEHPVEHLQGGASAQYVAMKDCRIAVVEGIYVAVSYAGQFHLGPFLWPWVRDLFVVAALLAISKILPMTSRGWGEVIFWV